jgi:hypothetical protein
VIGRGDGLRWGLGGGLQGHFVAEGFCRQWRSRRDWLPLQEVDDLVAAVGRAHEIYRADCGAAAERRFSLERMVSDHVRLYLPLIDQG